MKSPFNSNTQRHFEKSAQEYNSFRKTGFLGTLVAKEREVFLEFLPDVKNKEVLDLGCGSGLYTALLQEKGASVTALDFSFSMAKATKSIEKKTVVAAIPYFPFRKSFDIIICWGPLEFVKEQEQALQGIAALLNKGGTLLILYPRLSFGSFLYVLYHRFLHRVHLTIASRGKFKMLLTHTNFIIEKEKTVHFITYAMRCKRR